MRLTKKQQIFCDCLKACEDLKKAAAESGYSISRAKKNLENPKVVWFLERLEKESGAEIRALQGQKKIAGDSGVRTGVVGGGEKAGAEEPALCSSRGTEARAVSGDKTEFEAGGVTREFLISQIQKFWYGIIFEDETADLKDRIKASELIAKTTGAFGEPKCEEEPKPIRIVFGGEEEAARYGE